MREFKTYVQSNEVRKQNPDRNLAKSNAKAGLERLDLAKALLHTQKPKYVVENAFEALREVIDAVLFSKGYKSYSHEASVSYLVFLGFSPSEIAQVDSLRKQRNGIKYCSEESTTTQAETAVIIAEKTIKKILSTAKIL